MTGPVDYAAVLADLRAKRRHIDALIAGIGALVGGDPPVGGNDSSEAAEGDTDTPPLFEGVLGLGERSGAASGTRTNGGQSGIASDAFLGLSTSAAVKKYLATVRKPMSVRAICDAMRAGGQVNATDDKTTYTNVYSALKRGRDTDFIQGRNKEWGLQEWYGGKSGGSGTSE